jgi:hypothetical protein
MELLCTLPTRKLRSELEAAKTEHQAGPGVDSPGGYPEDPESAKKAMLIFRKKLLAAGVASQKARPWNCNEPKTGRQGPWAGPGRSGAAGHVTLARTGSASVTP